MWGYPEIRFLFPLDRSDWFWGEVEEDAVYSLYFVCDTLGDFMENGIGNFLYSGGHGIFGINGSDNCGPAFVTAFVFNSHAFNIGNGYEILPNLFGEAVLIELVAQNCICFAECTQSISCDGAEATNTKSGTGEGVTVDHCVRKSQSLTYNAILVLKQ